MKRDDKKLPACGFGLPGHGPTDAEDESEQDRLARFGEVEDGLAQATEGEENRYEYDFDDDSPEAFGVGLREVEDWRDPDCLPGEYCLDDPYTGRKTHYVFRGSQAWAAGRRGDNDPPEDG